MTDLLRRGSRAVLSTALAFAVYGCGGSDLLGVDGGGVQFVLSSPAAAFAPAASAAAPSLSDDDFDGHRGSYYFESANVTFSSILARNLDGVLVDVVMELPTTVDVVTMEGGREVVLPDGVLDPATYDQLVVVMRAVQGVTRDGTTITMEPPGGGWTSIVPVCEFVVEDGATTVVGLQFMLHRAFKWKHNRFHFEPRFECEPDVAAEPPPS